MKKLLTAIAASAAIMATSTTAQAARLYIATGGISDQVAFNTQHIVSVETTGNSNSPIYIKTTTSTYVYSCNSENGKAVFLENIHRAISYENLDTTIDYRKDTDTENTCVRQ